MKILKMIKYDMIKTVLKTRAYSKEKGGGGCEMFNMSVHSLKIFKLMKLLEPNYKI